MSDFRPEPTDTLTQLTERAQHTEKLAPLWRRRCLVVGKCTVPVGTEAELAELLKRLAPSESELAWNPEFLRCAPTG